MIVVDASAVVAGLIDTGPAGRWAEELLRTEPLAAPHHMPLEVAATLRRLAIQGVISADVASLAHADLADLSLNLVPYAPVASRSWALRSNVSVYDAAYVALAELIGVPLATLDGRLVSAPGPKCLFRTPHD